jgi:4'-phosphopantetheinyl transferase
MHFARCRSAVRFLLSRYLGIPAAEIRFEYQPNGKPEPAEQQSPRRLRFNVSHSAGLALIAASADHRLGIDIEKIRVDVDITTLERNDSSPIASAPAFGLCPIISACQPSSPAGRARSPSESDR